MAKKTPTASAPDVSYVITIRTENADSSTSGGADNPSNSSGAISESGSNVAPGAVAKTKDGEDVGGIGGRAIRGIAKVGGMKIGDAIITSMINRVDILSGNTTLQQKLSYQYSCARRGIIIGKAMLSGNPVAMIGGTMAALSWATDVAIARENLGLQRGIEEISIHQANIRAGVGRYGTLRGGY